MAGLRKLFCIGGKGGFMGADGINPISLQILVGQSDRFWLEPRYFDDTLKPIGKIQVIIPNQNDHTNSLIDACIAFSPEYFKKCPSLEKVKQGLDNFKRLDFDLHEEKIPESWNQLRKEAVPIFEKLNIFQADLVELDVDKKYPINLGEFPPGI